ncbi:GNAT family N-acetyltransferase [Amphibacillus indicireducens]|uniref:GNAT family N-acetyltransferase n=1 Tax=Amphibacillus indicireducens TaxID=1076330 RepID=A0ABP7VHR6_9BACI
MRLEKPTVDLKNEYIEFYQEWKNSGEKMIPFVIEKDPADFDAMLNYLSDCEKGIEPQGSWIAKNSTFWLVDHNKIIGVVNIRHSLTEQLFNSGGHIGYGIRPTRRKQGYGTKMLLLALLKAKELKIGKALLVCYPTNIASKKVILNNGGQKDNDFIDQQNNTLNRYWIELEDE